MKYQIGDKVELTNGCIVTITDIISTIDRAELYAAGIVPVPLEHIKRKVED